MMKPPLRFFLILFTLTLLAACGLLPGGPEASTPAVDPTQLAARTEAPAATTAPGGGESTPALPGEPVQNAAGLVSVLQAAGAQAEVGGEISQAFFPVGGLLVKVNGEDLQVYEFADAAAVEAEAARISPDGGQVGNTVVEWVTAPRFFRSGRLIVLYAGADQEVAGLLEDLLGAPFAGAGSPTDQATGEPGVPTGAPQTYAESCTPQDARLVPYQNAEAGYCLALPVRFEVEAADPHNVFISGPATGEGPEPLRGTLNITAKEGFHGRGLAEVVDEAIREYQDLSLSPAPGILGLEPAVVIEGLPGRTGTRQVFALHGDRLYHLIFGPVDPAFPEVEGDVRELWDAVMESFVFLEGPNPPAPLP